MEVHGRCDESPRGDLAEGLAATDAYAHHLRHVHLLRQVHGAMDATPLLHRLPLHLLLNVHMGRLALLPPPPQALIRASASTPLPHKANQPNPLTRLIQRSHREGAKGGVAGCCTCMAGASYQKADALIRSSTSPALSSHKFIFTQRAKRSSPSSPFPPPSSSAHRRGPYYPFFLVTEWPAMFCSAL